MKWAIIWGLLGDIYNSIPDETKKRFIDTILDDIERFIKNTPNKLDDKFVLPLIAAIRKVFNIPEYNS